MKVDKVKLASSYDYCYIVSRTFDSISLLIEPLDLQNWARKGAFLRLGITRCYVPYHSLIYYKQSSIEMDDIKN